MESSAIWMIIFAVLIVADLGARIYFKKKETANGTDEEKKEANEEILKDFLTVMKSISEECLEVVTLEKTMNKAEFEDVLARKIFTTFKETVGPHYQGTTIGVIIDSLPEDFIIQWIKNNVFNVDEIFKSLKEKDTAKVEQVNIVKELDKLNKEE